MDENTKLTQELKGPNMEEGQESGKSNRGRRRICFLFWIGFLLLAILIAIIVIIVVVTTKSKFTKTIHKGANVPESSGCIWEMQDSMFLASNNDRTIRLTGNQTVEYCKTECVAETRFECLTFDYNRDLERCFLAAISYQEANADNLLRSDSDYVIYARNATCS